MTNQDQVTRITEGFLAYLRENGYEDLLANIVAALQAKIIHGEFVTIHSPAGLTAVQKAKTRRLVEKLTARTGIPIRYQTDPSLVNGLKVVFGDTVWDMTLAGQIKKLRRDLIQ